MDDRVILEKFLCFDLTSTNSVFDEFAGLDNAVYYGELFGSDDFIYVPGTRRDRVVLVAHADTYWNGMIPDSDIQHRVVWDKGGYYRSGDPAIGIGADDRAGCAIVYLLKDLGHSLLITSGEEIGSLGARRIREDCPRLYDELNEHQYMIEFDRCNARDYKVYNIPVSEEFQQFIEDNTGYREAGKSSFTDITILCRKICGANLSVGYYAEHTPDERLVYGEWKNTLDIARKMLFGEQKKFPVLKHPANLGRAGVRRLSSDYLFEE